MTAKSQEIPPLKFHKATGQAYVRIAGKMTYFGKHDLPETQQNYRQFIAEWLRVGGQKLPQKQNITVAELCAHFWKYLESYYGPDNRELSQFKYPLRLLRELYGHSDVNEVGPKAIKTVQQAMIEKGWCRRQINKYMSKIKRLFRWAAQEELITGDRYHAITSIEGLRKGKCKAQDYDPVIPAPEEYINAVEPYVSRQVWALIQLQLFTGARAGELVIMRPCDIDRSGRIWIYTPARHKTLYHGHSRTIYIGPQGQQILAPFLLRLESSYCFSPAEAEAYRRNQKHAQRKTPLSCGNRPGMCYTEQPQRTKGEYYTVDSYRRAITYAIGKAFPLPQELLSTLGQTKREWKRSLSRAQKTQIKSWYNQYHWHPHQLRHNTATYLRKEFGLETARIILGHKSVAITEIYAEVDQLKAIEAISKVG